MAHPTSSPHRGNWGSRMAFIMAAAGSAVGLGNIWGFPTMTARNGGAAFLVIYLLCVAVVALPVMLSEMAIGRAAQRNPVGAFHRLAPGRPWFLVGVLGVVTGIGILSFYSVIAGWTLYYFYLTATGTFQPGVDPATYYKEITEGFGLEIFFHIIFMLGTILVVAGGVRRGIERTTRILMPLLVIIMLLLIVRSVTLPNAGAGLSFYLSPDFSDVTAATVIAALGQAFFSLSLGMGAMITYGSYLKQEEDLPSSAGLVALADTFIAFLAGLIIFPALFFANLEPGEGGPGMIFEVLPQLFGTIPWQPWGGILFGSAFFLLLAVAALTSSISLLEVAVSYFVDQKNWSRILAVWVAGGISLVIGLVAAFSGDFFGWLITVFGSYALVIGALGTALFVGWGWSSKHSRVEIGGGDNRDLLHSVWLFLVRYVAPVAIVAILLLFVIGLRFGGAEEEEAPAAEPALELAE